MYVYAGIDEAGYGPLLGPLVICRSVFDVDRVVPGAGRPCLWETLAPVVGRSGCGWEHSIAVDDSKQLYSPKYGLRCLEQGILPFLYTAGIRPGCLGDLLTHLAYDDASFKTELGWYTDDTGGPQLPISMEMDDVESLSQALLDAASGAGTGLADVSAAVVFEDRFNRMVDASHSKALTAWRFVAGHIASIWDTFGDHCPNVVVDRQGGRYYYREPLILSFPDASIEILEETPEVSRYRLSEASRSIELTFQVNGDAHHLPVAFSSMAAKYLRELLMMRFQRFWQARAPEVRPTFGYHGDGDRFIREIEPLIARMGIDRDSLIRKR
jgi:hypothetical protein